MQPHKPQETIEQWSIQFAKCIGLLHATFANGQEMDDLAIEAYRLGLEGLPSSVIRAATQKVLQSPDYKFMPKPGELRLLAITGGQSVESQADQAWFVFNRAIDHCGGGRSVNFHDALINATVRLLGGWERCCSMPLEEFEKWYHRDFVNTYTRLLVNGCPIDAAGYLPGFCERENARWVGLEYGRGGKVYELPAPDEIACDYRPALASPPGRDQMTHRSPDAPRIDFRKAWR